MTEEKEIGKEIGKVTHYFDHLSVVIVELSDELKVGKKIHIKGHTTDFKEVTDSIQINKVEVKEAKAGDVIGLKVTEEAREGDRVYIVE